MFNELTQGREYYGSVSDNGRFPDWNRANMSSPTLYGYPYAPPSQGFVAPQFDVTVNAAAYKHNAGDDTMEFETVNSKGKVKIKKLSNGFAITNRVENYNEIGEIAFATITYTTKTYSSTTVIPGSEYMDGKFDKHFEYIVRLPGCSRAELNSLIGFALKAAPCQKQKLFPHQGICEFENKVINFASNPGFIKEIEKYISPSVLKRKPLVGFVSEEQVIENWRKVFCHQPVLCFLSNWYIMGIMQYFLNDAGIFIRDFPCIKLSNTERGLTEEKLISMLSTNNFHKYPVPTLESNTESIEKAHSEIYDGVFLVKEKSFADEEDKIIDGIKSIIRCIQNNNSGRNISMIVSKNAGNAAASLAPDNAIIIDTDSVVLDYTPNDIERITDEMASLIFSKALNDPAATKKWFKETVFYSRREMSIVTKGDSLDTLAAMQTIELFLIEFLGIFRYDFDVCYYYETTVKSKGAGIMSSNMEKKKEFGAKLSEKFRSKTFHCVKKVRNVRFDDDGITAVISGDRLLASSTMLGSVTNNVESMIEIFKADGDLICTDGYTHPFDSHDSTGKYQRLYYYDLPVNILDEDVLYMLQNPKTAAFLLNKEESKIAGFMPLVSVKFGKIAGKCFVYNDAENDSIAIYGQAGEGKSYTKHQIMASRFTQGYDILVFDTSASDTYEALCANLPQSFVDKKVVFHKLDDSELHINIFEIDRSASLPSQKKELVGIITAAVGDLSVPQANALRTVCSKLLEKTDVDKPISPDYLLKLLNREGGTYESLRNRLEPFIEDIKEYGLISGCWKDSFNGEHKIHIVQMNEGFSENGNQIVDALLAGLFNYKRENPQHPLSVFIDEAQNHNMSVTSPIRKIMKEGRKHHLSLVTATQDFYARGTEIGSALGKAGMQIHHRPTQDSANLVAAELRWNKVDMSRFDSMNRGDAIIKGALFNKELNRNAQTTIEGRIYPFTVDDYIDNEDEKIKNDN